MDFMHDQLRDGRSIRLFESGNTRVDFVGTTGSAVRL